MIHTNEERSFLDENRLYMISSDEEVNENLKPIYGPQGQIRQNNGWAFNFIYGRDDSETRDLGLFKVGQTTQFPLFDTRDLSLSELKSKLKEAGFEEINGMLITFDKELAQKILIGGRYSSEKASQQAAKFQAHWVALAVKSDGSGFTDKQFHIHLDPFNVPHAGETEWFNKNSAELVSALGQFIRGEELTLEYADSLEQINADSLTRPQKEGADFLREHLLVGDSVLLDCVMRYGKTITTLFAIRSVWLQNPDLMKSALVLSHVTVTAGGWLEDALKVFKSREVAIYSQQGIPSNLKGKGYPIFTDFSKAEEEAESNSKLLLVFNSLQQAKNQKETDFLLNREWSVRVVDEAHRGTRSKKSQDLYGRIRYRASIEVSGTPFNLASDYQRDKVFSFNYFDEIREKITLSERDLDSLSVSEQRMLQLPELALHVLDCRNAFKLPKTQDELMKIFSEVRLDDASDKELLEKLQSLQDQVDNGEISSEVADKSFAELTKNDTGNMRFKYEEDVKDFFKLIRNGDENKTFPYRWQEHFDHSVIFMPSAVSALALKNLLEELTYKNPVTGDIERYYDHKIIATVYGEAIKEKDSSGKRKFASDLDSVKDAIANNPRTITIDYNKMGTGVTIPEWSAVFMLNNNADAKRYLQLAFRAKTPATIKGRVKERAYVFDVNSERLYNIINQISVWGDGKTSRDKLKSVIRYLGITKETFGGFSEDYAKEWKFETVTYGEVFEEINRQFFEAVNRNNYGILDLSSVDFKPNKSDLSLFKQKSSSKKKATSPARSVPFTQVGLFSDGELMSGEDKVTSTNESVKESTNSEDRIAKQESDLREYVNNALPFIPFILFMANVDYEKILGENGVKDDYRAEIAKISPELLLDYLGPRGTEFFTEIFYKIPTHELILTAWIKGLKEIQLDSKTELEKVAALQVYLDSLASLRPDSNFVFTPTKVAKLLVDNFSLEDYVTPGKLTLDVGGKEGAPLVEMYRRILNAFGEDSNEVRHFKNTVSSLAMNAKGYQILKRVYQIFGWNEAGIIYAPKSLDVTFGMSSSEIAHLSRNNSHEAVKRFCKISSFEEALKKRSYKKLSRQLEAYKESLKKLSEVSQTKASVYAKQVKKASKNYEELLSTMKSYLTEIQPETAFDSWCLEKLTNGGKISEQEIIERAEEIVKSITQETTLEGIKKALMVASGRELKFSVIVGNPPYQLDLATGQQGEKIYQDFYLLAREIGNIVSMIFLKGWENHNLRSFAEMRADQSLLLVDNYYETPQSPIICFPEAGTGGVSIVLRDSSHNDGPSFLEYGIKVDKDFYAEAPENKRGISHWFDSYRESAGLKRIPVWGGAGNGFAGIPTSYSQENLTALRKFSDGETLENLNDSGITLVQNSGKGKSGHAAIFLIAREEVRENVDAIDKWKVVAPANWKPSILGPGVMPGRIRPVVGGVFDSHEEAINCSRYIKTRLVSVLKEKAPGLNDYTNSNPIFTVDTDLGVDHEYRGLSLDERLYMFFGLSENEISMIENQTSNE